MNKRLPLITATAPHGLQSDISHKALERFVPFALASNSEDKTTLNILGAITSTPWRDDGEVSAAMVANFLAQANGQDVQININSPGGDMFEGIAIYNLLQQYQGNVTIHILGLAASAASIVAMGASSLHIAPSAFLMIHNCWLVVAGNRHDLIKTAHAITPFDDAMANVYASRSGMEKHAIAVMMDNETYISGSDAVNMGLADALLDFNQPNQAVKQNANARQKLDILLAKQGYSRAERREFMQELKAATLAASGVSNTQNAIDSEVLRELRAFKAAVQAA